MYRGVGMGQMGSTPVWKPVTNAKTNMYIYIYIFPCATSFYPNAFSRQQAKPKVIIQDVAE